MFFESLLEYSKWLLGCCYAVTECSEWSLGVFGRLSGHCYAVAEVLSYLGCSK